MSSVRNSHLSEARIYVRAGDAAKDVAISIREPPPPGAHLISRRWLYDHHGIYVGDGKVVHYGTTFRCGLSRRPVEEVSLERFTAGHSLWIRNGARPRFIACEVTERARSRLGENNYDLLRNNCEHFCEWCLRDAPVSYQIEQWRSLPSRVADLLKVTVGRLPGCSQHRAQQPLSTH